MPTKRPPAKKATAPRRAPTAHEIQAAVEGVGEVVDQDTVELLGQRFRIAQSIGMMPMLKFAHASANGLDTDSMEGLAAVYEMLRDCVDQVRPTELVTDDDGEPVIDPETKEQQVRNLGPSEWDRFERHAVDAKADGDDLLPVVNQAIELITARKARQPGASSDGQPSTSGSSKGTSSLPAGRLGPSPEELAALTPVNELNTRTR